MITKKNPFIVSLLLIFISVQLNAQSITSLPRSTPEVEGVSSKAILNFLEAADKSVNELHSFMFLRHGKVIAEGWWNPYTPDLENTVYSVSKSFNSTAIGFAVSEKRLTVNDKVISFFPDDLPYSVSLNLSKLRVRDLLSMSVGHEQDPTPLRFTVDSNWAKAFLAVPITNKPGTRFLYNTIGSFILSAIVQKLTGEKVIDYLKPRLFDPLGITGMDWEVNPDGINTGGWGLRIKTEDMAKFGQLYLQKGVWNGRQILPQGWINEATTKKIDQEPDAPQAKKDTSDWLQGYCYQFWRCRNNAFRADGALGQYIIIMPDQDAVIAITSETPDMQNEIKHVWKYLFPAMQEKKLGVDQNSLNALKHKLSSLAVHLPDSTKGFIRPGFSHKTIVLDSNEQKIEAISFRFENNVCYLNLKYDTASYDLAFGSSKWELGETNRPGPSIVLKAKGHLLGIPPAKVAGCYSWKDPNSLELTLRYIESPHTETMLFHFANSKVFIEFSSSQDENPKIELEGILIQ